MRLPPRCLALLVLGLLHSVCDSRVVEDARRPAPAPQDLRVYMINLDSRPDRLAEALQTWGSNVQDILRVRRVPALPHRDGPDDIQNGCTASHLMVLREVFLEEGYQGVILVLEDDARPSATFWDDFPRILSLAQATAAEWDVLQLAPAHLVVGGTTDLTFPSGFSVWPPGRGLIARAETVASTGALLYSPRIASSVPAMEAVVRGASRKTQPVAAIDNLLSSFRDLTHLVVVGVQQMLWQAPGLSDVSQDAYDGTREHIAVSADLARLSALLAVTAWVAGAPGQYFPLDAPFPALRGPQRPHTVACSTYTSYTAGMAVTYACTPGLVYSEPPAGEGWTPPGPPDRKSVVWRTSLSRPTTLAFPPLPRVLPLPRLIASVDAVHPLWLADPTAASPPPLPEPLRNASAVVNVCLIVGGPTAPAINPGLAVSYMLHASRKCQRVVHVTTPRLAVQGSYLVSPGARLGAGLGQESAGAAAVRARQHWGDDPLPSFWAAVTLLPALPAHCGHSLATLAADGPAPRSHEDAPWGKLHARSVIPAVEACVTAGLGAAEAWAAAHLPPHQTANVTSLYLLPIPPLADAPLHTRNDALLLWEAAVGASVRHSVDTAAAFLQGEGLPSPSRRRRLAIPGQTVTGGFGRHFDLPTAA